MVPASAPASPAAAADARGAGAAACKICLVGDPGVGKTALAQRLLHDRFPPAPSAPGITVELLRLEPAPGESLALAVWDVAARAAIDSLNQAFLSRVEAVAAIADPARPATVERAAALVAQIRRLYPGTPALLLLNCRAAAAAAPAGDAARELPRREVDARDGRGLQAAFVELARAALRRRVRA